MATYTWSIPAGNAITSSTKVKDTDNYIANTIDDLVDFVNGEGEHIGAGLTYDLVDKANSQTIAGIKTFSSAIIANGGVTGNVTGNTSGSSGSCTGNSATATKLATARTIAITGNISGSASFDGSASIEINITDATPSSHIGSGGTSHANATTSTAGFMSSTDKTKLDGVASNANNYTLPSGTSSTLGGVKIYNSGSTLYIATV